MRAYVTERRRAGGTALATLMAIPGIRGKLAYARHLLFPSTEFLAARAPGGRPSRLRRLLVPLRWLRRGRWTRV